MLFGSSSEYWTLLATSCYTIGKGYSSILILFYYLAPLQNDSIMTSLCMQFTFEDKREVYLLDESVLPVTEKERRRGKKKHEYTIVIIWDPTVLWLKYFFKECLQNTVGIQNPTL